MCVLFCYLVGLELLRTTKWDILPMYWFGGLVIMAMTITTKIILDLI